MVFKKLLGTIGVGGPSVDTVLPHAPVLPGGGLAGHVHLEGGSSDAEIEQIVLELVARVEAESYDGEHEGAVVFERVTVSGGFRLSAAERKSIPFSLALPWETPLTELHGQHLGIVLGVRTELQVAGARDKGDLDPLRVAPLPAQEAVLEALGQLGYEFRSADLELGHIHGTGQQLPFYQEIELVPPAQYAHALGEVELTFLPRSAGVEVVLEADRRGGLFASGHDAVNLHSVSHAEAGSTDWMAKVDGWMRQLIDHHGSHGQYAHGDPHHGEFAHGDNHSHGGHHGSSKPGMGTAVAVGAAGMVVGVAGGLVAAEVVDEIGDVFEGEGEDTSED